MSREEIVEGSHETRLVTSAGTISAAVAPVDAADDLALLKADGQSESFWNAVLVRLSRIEKKAQDWATR